MAFVITVPKSVTTYSELVVVNCKASEWPTGMLASFSFAADDKLFTKKVDADEIPELSATASLALLRLQSK